LDAAVIFWFSNKLPVRIIKLATRASYKVLE